jgi:sigma-B regulation protein RsbU (phosphoserine phosphatase)
MRVLIAEDDAVSRRMLQAMLTKWGYDVAVTATGSEALAVFQEPDAPSLAIIDWEMPGMDGVELCQHVRVLEKSRRTYILMLTGKTRKEDVVAGLEAGADDYLAKPFDRDELRARLHVGVRILQLQSELADRVHQLETALANVRLLQGLLPICCYCKKVRNDGNYWQQVETYIMEHSAAQFSHGICPDCYDSVVKPELEALKRKPQEIGCGHR